MGMLIGDQAHIVIHIDFHFWKLKQFYRWYVLIHYRFINYLIHFLTIINYLKIDMIIQHVRIIIALELSQLLIWFNFIIRLTISKKPVCKYLANSFDRILNLFWTFISYILIIGENFRRYVYVWMLNTFHLFSFLSVLSWIKTHIDRWYGNNLTSTFLIF